MRPPRNKDPEIYRLITIRTDEARLWMTPTNKVRKTLGGIVARYQEMLGIIIYAYCFLSNHYHLLVKAPKGNIDEFEENINREIARRINWKNHRRGKFWSRPYADQEPASPEDVLEAFLYITTNAVKHGLVEHAVLWPGLCSYEHCLNEKDLTFSFTEYSAFGGPKTTNHRLVITALPPFAGLPRAERAKKVRALISERERELAAKRREAGQGFLGVEKVLAQDPSSVPQNVSRSRRGVCYTKNIQLYRQKRREARERRNRYAEASFRYRLGERDVEFPPFSFFPPLHRLPRLLRFTPVKTCA